MTSQEGQPISLEIQVWMGFELMTSVIPVECSTNWAIQPILITTSDKCTEKGWCGKGLIFTKTNKKHYLHYNAEIFSFLLHSQTNFSKIEYQQFTLRTVVHNGHNTDTEFHNLTQHHQTSYCPLGTNDRIGKPSSTIINLQVQSLIIKSFLDCLILI